MSFHTDYDPNKTLCGTQHSMRLTVAQEIAFAELMRRIHFDTLADATRYLAQVGLECLGLLPRTSVTDTVDPVILSALDLRRGDALDSDPFTGSSTSPHLPTSEE